MKGGRRLILRLGSAATATATAGWPWSSSGGVFSSSCNTLLQQKQLMVTKAPDRSAVHGTRPPVTRTINIEQVEEEINAGKENKEKKIEEIQKRIDRNDDNTDVHVDDVGGSSNSSSSHSTKLM